MEFVLEEKFHIERGKEKLIMDYLPVLRRTIEEQGGKWLGCYVTSLGEGEYGEYEMFFQFKELNWLEELFDELDKIPESENWKEFTYQRSNKILKLRY